MQKVRATASRRQPTVILAPSERPVPFLLAALHLLLLLLTFNRVAFDGAEAAPIQLVSDFPSFALSLFMASEAEQQRHEAAGSHAALSARSTAQRRPGTHQNEVNDDDDNDDELEETAADDAAAMAAAASITDLLVAGARVQNDTLLPHVIELNYDNLNQELGNVAKLAEHELNGSSLMFGHQQHLGSTSHPHHHKSFLGALGTNAKPRTGHFVHLANGQSVQFCDSSKAELNCDDENAICKLGACVCKPGYYLNRQSSWCQSISDLMQNCENDFQCQAINVDLVCDTKNTERPVCDCIAGLYFDQETHTCLPCHRNSFILTPAATRQPQDSSSSSSLPSSLANSTGLEPNVTRNATNGTLSANRLAINQTFANANTSASNGSQTQTPASAQLRPCRPIDLSKLSRRKQKLYGLFPFAIPATQYDDSGERSQMMANGLGKAAHGSGGNLLAGGPSSTSSSSSDPFRIKTPIEVFMGAIMLFTLFTITWFFLQRIIHDCRTIMRTIRNPPDLASCDSNFTGTFTTTTTTALDGHPQANGDSLAAARLAAALAANGHTDYIETTPGFFTRRSGAGLGYMATTLTGAYHRSLAASLMNGTANGTSNSSTNGTATTTTLSPSSTNQRALATASAAAAAAAGPPTRSAITRLVGDDMAESDLVAPMYPFIHHSGANSSNYSTTTSLSQRELSAQEATACFLASARAGDHHQGLAIWRVAMAQSRFNYPPSRQSMQQLNYFGPTAFDPPPKYEEAVAQDAAHLSARAASGASALARLPESSPDSSQNSSPINYPTANNSDQESIFNQIGPNNQERESSEPVGGDGQVSENPATQVDSEQHEETGSGT